LSSRRRTGWRVPPFLGLSILTHVLVIAILAVTDVGRACNTGPGPFDMAPVDRGPIDVTMIEPSVLNPYAARPTAEEEKQEQEKKVEEAKKPEEKPDEGGQVVDTARPNVEIRPEKSKYLGQFDSKVERETKAPPSREPGAGRPRVASVSRPPQPATPRVEEVPEKAPQPESHGGRLAMRAPSPIEKPSEERGKEDGLTKAQEGTEAPEGTAPAVPPVADRATGEERAGEAGQAGQKGSPGSEEIPRANDLRPSDEMLARAAAGGGSDDYLKDVDEGQETLLNTKRWKYWSFFDRVKKGVAHQWRPDMAYRLRDPTGQIYGFKNRFTVLKVSLKPDGSLSHVSIEKPCGVDFLDDEAVSAMRTAQPFPNPPEGLIDPDSHLITFRFGFMFEIGGAPRFRVYRQ